MSNNDVLLSGLWSFIALIPYRARLSFLPAPPLASFLHSRIPAVAVGGTGRLGPPLPPYRRAWVDPEAPTQPIPDKCTLNTSSLDLGSNEERFWVKSLLLLSVSIPLDVRDLVEGMTYRKNGVREEVGFHIASHLITFSFSMKCQMKLNQSWIVDSINVKEQF